MTTTAALYQSNFVPTSEAALITAAQKTIIDKCNSSAVLGGTVTLRIVPAAGTSGSQHQQASKVFNVADTYTWPEIVGQTLEAGDSIRAVCTVASAVTIRISGRLIT